uniref:SDR family oxidoreductase n=1 Tax=Roseihalotalea indica TaxID=2867963 RepID=A0AA49GPQ7_9BACT|nr:SDR family oxidoreductase [Tunicatimonas sp. TK19036]
MQILVTGATGELGSSVLKILSKKLPANQIAVLTRKEEKRMKLEDSGFQAFLGDYDNVSALENAMRNVDTVLLISAGDQGNRMQQHKNVIDSAKKMGVKCIAYTSRSLRERATLENQLMLEHFETEDYIQESGLDYTIFRNALYMDVIPIFVGKKVFETGIYQPAGDGKVAFALREEMGEAIANVLLTEKCQNKIYTFTGSEAYSFYDIANALSELSNKKVKYTPVAVPAFKEMMMPTGLPENMVKKIIDFNTDIKNNQEAEITHELEEKLGRKPTSLKDGLKDLFEL